MIEKPLVSIIIPVFNVRSYIEESLNSVCQQTYKNIEIIIIDDGSDDGSSEICDEYARLDNRVRLIHQVNKGLSSARNRGLDIMKGAFVTFLDSDDVYHSSFIEKMVDAINKNQVDLVISKAVNCYTTKRIDSNSMKEVFPSIEPDVYNRIDSLKALADFRINTAVWNKLYKNTLWDSVRFPDGHVFEDLDTIFKIIDKCNSICVINQPLYYYRIREGSISKTQSNNNSWDRIIAWTHFVCFIEKNTPQIFSLDQLKRRRQDLLNTMISTYPKLYYCNYDSNIEIGNIRNKIISIGDEVGVSNFSLTIKITYWIIVLCPLLLKAAYPSRRILRDIVHKTINRCH